MTSFRKVNSLNIAIFDRNSEFPVVSRCSRGKVKWQSAVRKGILLKTVLKESQKAVAMTVFMEARDFWGNSE